MARPVFDDNLQQILYLQCEMNVHNSTRLDRDCWPLASSHTQAIYFFAVFQWNARRTRGRDEEERAEEAFLSSSQGRGVPYVRVLRIPMDLVREKPVMVPLRALTFYTSKPKLYFF